MIKYMYVESPRRLYLLIVCTRTSAFVGGKFKRFSSVFVCVGGVEVGVQRCVKKCPHFKCVTSIHRFVLALNAWTNTLYTRVYIVSSL